MWYPVNMDKYMNHFNLSAPDRDAEAERFGAVTPRPLTAAFFTLGCKVNQFETQAMERLWEARGHNIVPFDDAADAYVVNTCSVTAAGDRKSRQVIRRVRRERPDAIVAVCGCYSQTHPAEAETLDADLVCGTGDRAAFVRLLEEAVNKGRAPSGRAGAEDRACAGRETPPSPDGIPAEAVRSGRLPVPPRRPFELLPAGRLEKRTRAMLKVEDGCANFCAYCIIPYARGGVRSAPAEAVIRQAETLAADGVREIVLTGIEISSWGQDLREGKSLIDLTEAVCAAVPDVRIRLGSLEPRTITEAFCARAAVLPNLCPQFHLSLQSGCDATLRRMNRRYTAARFLQSVTLLRRSFPRPAITTDLIVGFPEETEEEFAVTLDFLKTCAFAKVHVFPYSPRPGTPAAQRPQIPGAVKEERARRAAAAAWETRRAYLEGCVGACYSVLFEQPEGAGYTGRAPNYMPVFAPGERLHNAIRQVRILARSGDRLIGEITETEQEAKPEQSPGQERKREGERA